MKTKTIIVYSDPGHGWGKATRLELVKLGILKKISSCSYQRNDWVYLEEDGDLSLYVHMLKKFGYEIKFKEFHTDNNSKIRNYKSFELNQIDLSVVAVIPSYKDEKWGY